MSPVNPGFYVLWGDPQRRRVKIKRPSRPPLKGGDVLGGRGFVLDVSIEDWKEPFIRMPLACWIATLNLYPLLVSLISVHPPPSLTNPGFITWGSVHRPLYLRFGLAALRRFFVRFSSNLRPEGLLKGVHSNQGRISDGTWFRNRRGCELRVEH